MNTKDFKTRTLINKRMNPCRKEAVWPIAIDMGYSSVKGMSRNILFCFPSYAKKLAKNSFTLASPLATDILYREKKGGDIYAVGDKANNMISIDTSNDSNSVLFGRNRYFSDIFKVTSRAGMALSLMNNEYGSPEGKKLMLQTGLPPAYMSDDTELIKEAFAGHHEFEIKVGTSDWLPFEFQLDMNDIRVMQQPMGTMVSVATDKNGIPTMDAEQLFMSNMLIFDPGFRTGDSCYVKKGSIDPDDCHTFPDLSMIEVLTRTSYALNKELNVSVSVPAMQPYLDSGMVKLFNRKTLKSESVDFSQILDRENKAVCQNAIDKLLEVYNYFIEVDFLTLTGGTGAAWSHTIRDRLSSLKTVTILSGNRNEDLPHIFSNVRGYYMYLMNRV